MRTKELHEQIGKLIEIIGDQPVVFRIENNGQNIDVEDFRVDLHASNLFFFIHKGMENLEEENRKLRERAENAEEEAEHLLVRLSDVETNLEELQEKLNDIVNIIER